MRIRYLFTLPLLGIGSSLMAADVLSYDANGDGVVTREEFMALQSDGFQTLDGNDDGVVSIAEFQTFVAQTAARAVNGKRLLERDGNGDGLVDEAEFLSMAPGFERADRNNDQVLTGKELALVADFLAKAGY